MHPSQTFPFPAFLPADAPCGPETRAEVFIKSRDRHSLRFADVSPRRVTPKSPAVAALDGQWYYLHARAHDFAVIFLDDPASPAHCPAT